jgi:hypothetical protein
MASDLLPGSPVPMPLESWLFLLLSTAALAAAASANVMLPVMLKRHFPHRVGGSPQRTRPAWPWD